MANLGFRLAMEEHGITVVETAVGDRYVLEAIDAGGFSLGGEQSGHIIFRDRATTGDGILTGITLLDVVRRSGMPLAELAADVFGATNLSCAPYIPYYARLLGAKVGRGVALLPSLFTMGNMFCGYACIVYAMRGDFDTAAPFMSSAP